eukprot:Em0005g374a
MASKRKLSGAESRKSKWQRELLRSAEATESITTYFARTACSAVSTSEGCRTLVTTGTSAESKSLTAPDTCTSQPEVLSDLVSVDRADRLEIIQGANIAVGITTSSNEGEALCSSSLEHPTLSSPQGDSVPSTSNHLTGVVALYRLLHPLAMITKCLQGKAVDIVKAFRDIQEVKHDFQCLRDGVDMEFQAIYNQAERLGQSVGVEPSLPRIAKMQMYRMDKPPPSEICGCTPCFVKSGPLLRLKNETRWSACYYAYLAAVVTGVIGDAKQSREMFLETAKLVKKKNNNVEKFCYRRNTLIELHTDSLTLNYKTAASPLMSLEAQLMAVEVVYLWRAVSFCGDVVRLQLLEVLQDPLPPKAQPFHHALSP